MAKQTVEVRGLPELNRAFKGLLDKTQKQVIQRAVKSGADIVFKSAKSNANAISPNVAMVVERRQLRKRHIDEAAYTVNIRPKNPKKVDSRRAAPKIGGGSGRQVRTINTNTYWGQRLAEAGYALIANFFEYGTSKVSKRPLLGHAYESTKIRARDEIKAKILSGIEKAAREEGVKL